MQYTVIKKYNIERKTITELGKFSILWNIFEKDYFQKKCCPHKIKNYQNYNITKSLKYNCENFINVLHAYLGTSKSTITRNIIKATLFDNSNEYHTEIEYVLKNKCDGTKLLIGTILIILRLRNNMFHGIKDCLNINNQLQLFISANIILNKLIEKRDNYNGKQF